MNKNKINLKRKKGRTAKGADKVITLPGMTASDLEGKGLILGRCAGRTWRRPALDANRLDDPFGQARWLTITVK
jgi:hypothetical protein